MLCIVCHSHLFSSNMPNYSVWIAGPEQHEGPHFLLQLRNERFMAYEDFKFEANFLFPMKP